MTVAREPFGVQRWMDGDIAFSGSAAGGDRPRSGFMARGTAVNRLRRARVVTALALKGRLALSEAFVRSRTL